MKSLFIVAEGIADFPSRIFDDKTPLELARTPWLDKLAMQGRTGSCKTIPSFSHPGSDTAFISLLGNNPSRVEGGRGYFEARGLGLEMSDQETVFRVNLITEKDGQVLFFGCPSISDDEGVLIANSFNEHFSNLPVKFYPLSGYRLLMVANNDWLFGSKKRNLKTYTPKSVGKCLTKDLFPMGNGSEKLISIIQEAFTFLGSHEINHVKLDLGENPVNAIWIWGNQIPKKVKTFQELYGMNAFCIPGTHLIRGIALNTGLDAAPVIAPHSKQAHEIFPKRVDAAIRAFEVYDAVIMHIETIGEIGQTADLQRKCQVIESFDEKVVGRLLDHLQHQGDFRILVATSYSSASDRSVLQKMTVPWVFYGAGISADKSKTFNEKEARSSFFSTYAGYKLLKKTLFRK